MLLEYYIAHLLESSRAKANPNYGDDDVSPRSVSNHSPCLDMFELHYVHRPMLPEYPVKVRDLIVLTSVTLQPMMKYNNIYDKKKLFIS